MGRPVSVLEVEGKERAELQRRLRSATTSKRDHLRAAIVLRRAEGIKQADLAAELGVSIACVNKWSHRFELNGLKGLQDALGRGRKHSIPVHKVERVITEATRPPKPKKRWTVRSMAREVGISPDSVHRLWKANDIKPHLTRQFKLSKDPKFEQKFWDVIGLYMNPPERGIVLCCDEKTQLQALERTQPGLPLGIGHIKTKTHDYRRHGTVSLFAAMSYLDGKIISRTEQKHSHVEWLRFLKQIERETPRELVLHLILDNASIHKEHSVKKWLARRQRRFQLHFTPTGSSWMNLVERFFADLSTEVVRDGSFASVRQLTKDIEEYLAQRNLEPKPYVWRADGQAILAKIARAREALMKTQEAG